MIVWSIGLFPVQEWIAEARRSRDLKIGSASLSWLTAGVLQSLTRRGATLIVPSLDSLAVDQIANQSPEDLLNSSYGIPNRASGWIAAPIDAMPFQSLQQVADAKWDELREGAHTHCGIPDLKPYLASVTNPIRVSWCAHDLDIAALPPTEADLRDALRTTDTFFVATKRARVAPVQSGSPVGKCGQCGRREASGPADWNSWRKFHQSVDGFAEVIAGARIEVGERLCAICLVKRFAAYLTNASFPSTSEIAARDWLHRVRTFDDLRSLVDKWERDVTADPALRADPFPLLYPRTTARRMAVIEPNQALRNSQELTDQIAEIIRKDHSGLSARPPEYLAVITFDGDDMGRMVQEHPIAMPAALRTFSAEIHGAIEEAHATSVYLGGDEGLILCPIETALALSHVIRDRFESAAAATFATSTPRPTLSVGVAIFDRERPLGAAIQAARRALDVAKQMVGKSALAVNVTTASGNRWIAVEHWGESWDRVRAAIDLTRGQSLRVNGHVVEIALSSGWAYDVERFIETLPREAFTEPHQRDAIRREIQRITHRHLEVTVPNGVDPAEMRLLAGAEVWRRLQGNQWWQSQPDDAALHSLSSTLHFIAFQTRESSVASEIASAGEDLQ